MKTMTRTWISGRGAIKETMLQNCKRDHGEFAWVPSPGTKYGFCIVVASNGWRKIRSSDHAEYLHHNCKCEYVVRFDGKTEIDGYDPQRYKLLYDISEGRNSDEKLKSLRKMLNNLILDKNYNISTNKEEITYGGKVKLISESMNAISPDYEWNGRYWDLKTPVSNSLSSVDKLVHKGMKQILEKPGGVILNIKKEEPNIEQIVQAAVHRMNRESNHYKMGKTQLIVRYCGTEFGKIDI